MSFNDGNGDISSGQSHTTHKRKSQRPCDICRRRKTRCDAVQMPGTRCSTCKSHNFDCTFLEDAQKRIPPPPKSYVEGLEKRAEKLDNLLRQLSRDEMVYNELKKYVDNNWIIENPLDDPSTLVDKIELGFQGYNNQVGTVISPGRHTMKDHISSLTEPYDEEDSTSILADLNKMLILSDSPFIGESSEVMLARTAFKVKNEYMANNDRSWVPKNPAIKHQRLEFWTIRPWEWQSDETAPLEYTFPDLDFALHCIDLYFKRDNFYIPLLHRPTFDKYVQEGRYLTDENFGSVFLLVCAVGARYSDDPRIFLDNDNPSCSSGWKWFNQVKRMKRSLTTPSTLEDLQCYCLCIQFIAGSSSPQSCSTLTGVAIRLALDAGAHRRKPYSSMLTPEEELWKRAFWALASMDRMVSSAMGRPCSIHDQDFDLDWPVECDDEYWDNPDPAKRFKQPPNKPSLISAYKLRLKLYQILGMALGTVYAINKSKILLGFAKQHWEQDLVAGLDSELNKWLDTIPDYLRWNPNHEDDDFFNQSVTLYAEYYYIQTIIHRPFIPMPNTTPRLTFPSLAICTNAARSCTHVLHIQWMKNQKPAFQALRHTLTAAVVLLVGIWGAKLSNLSTDSKKEMAEVDKCMNMLKTMEKEFFSAGRVWDALHILTSKTSTGELPLLRQGAPSGTRRAHESRPPLSTGPTESPSNPTSQNEMPGTIPGSFPKESPFATQMQRPPEPQQSAYTPSPNADSAEFTLPMYSNELGSIPLHGQVSFSAQAHSSQPHIQLPQLYPHSDSGRSIPTSFVSHSEASPSYGFHHPMPSAPMPQQQQQQYPHHVPQSIATDWASSTSGASPMAQDLYSVVLPEMNAPMSFESMLGHNQQPNPEYGLIPMEFSNTTLMGSNSMALPPPPPNEGSFMDNMYSGLAKAPVSPPDYSTYDHQHYQHQGVPQQGESFYPFSILETNTAAVWSNAPTDFELSKWGAYLREMMMQERRQHASS